MIRCRKPRGKQIPYFPLKCFCFREINIRQTSPGDVENSENVCATSTPILKGPRSNSTFKRILNILLVDSPVRYKANPIARRAARFFIILKHFSSLILYSKVCPQAKSQHRPFFRDMAAVANDGIRELTTRTEKLSITSINKSSKQFKAQIKELDKQYETMQQQLEDLHFILEVILKWDEDFKKVVRFSQGVPHMRSTKEICANIKTAMIPSGEFDRTVQVLVKEGVPCFSRVTGLFEKMKSRLDERSPNAKFSEEMRQLLGELIGTLCTIMNFFYDQEV